MTRVLSILVGTLRLACLIFGTVRTLIAFVILAIAIGTVTIAFQKEVE